MRKISLRMNEEQKYQVIKVLMDHGGNKQRVAVKSGVTVLTVNRYIISDCLVIRAFDGQIFAPAG